MNGLSSKNSTALTSSSILAVVSAMNDLSAACMGARILSVNPRVLRSVKMAPGLMQLLGGTMAWTYALLAAGLALAPLTAQAQSYRCVGADGKKYYGSTIPQECMGLLVEQLSPEGHVIRRHDPQGDEKQRIAKEAAA